jgi:hypothetical protein
MKSHDEPVFLVDVNATPNAAAVAWWESRAAVTVTVSTESERRTIARDDASSDSGRRERDARKRAGHVR